MTWCYYNKCECWTNWSLKGRQCSKGWVTFAFSESFRKFSIRNCTQGQLKNVVVIAGHRTADIGQWGNCTPIDLSLLHTLQYIRRFAALQHRSYISRAVHPIVTLIASTCWYQPRLTEAERCVTGQKLQPTPRTPSAIPAYMCSECCPAPFPRRRSRHGSLAHSAMDGDSLSDVLQRLLSTSRLPGSVRRLVEQVTHAYLPDVNDNAIHRMHCMLQWVWDDNRAGWLLYV